MQIWKLYLESVSKKCVSLKFWFIGFKNCKSPVLVITCIREIDKKTLVIFLLQLFKTNYYKTK